MGQQEKGDGGSDTRAATAHLLRRRLLAGPRAGSSASQRESRVMTQAQSPVPAPIAVACPVGRGKEKKERVKEGERRTV